MPRCQPEAKVWASCGPDPDGAGRYLLLHAATPTYPEPHNRDLCVAFAAADYTQSCAASSTEFARFGCKEPSATVARALPVWKDANGNQLGIGATVSMANLPAFPVHALMPIAGKPAIWELIRHKPSGQCPLPLASIGPLR